MNISIENYCFDSSNLNININQSTYHENGYDEVLDINFINNMNLSNPYFLYPNGPMSEYFNYSEYNLELKRLYKKFLEIYNWIISNMNSSRPNTYVLNSIIVGSAMEQAIRTGNNEPGTFFQWQQLFPTYITNFIESYRTDKENILYVNLIIVSPDKIFSDEFYKEPIFLGMTEYQFVKISNRKYLCRGNNFEISVDIFNCPLPSHDSREYVKKINDFYLSRKEDFSHIHLNSYIQTESDTKFIDKFYKLVDMLFGLVNNINIYIIINSWATFKNLDGYENYKMFSKLLELANKNNILATEWAFRDKSYLTKIMSNFLCEYVSEDKNTGKISSKGKKSVLFKNIVYTDIIPDYSIYNGKLQIYNSIHSIYFEGGISIYEL